MKSSEWKKLKEDRLVKITWHDAWYRYNPSDLIGPLETYIVGWVVYVDKNGVKVCCEKTEFDHYRHEHYIPRKMIGKIRVIK